MNNHLTGSDRPRPTPIANSVPVKWVLSGTPWEKSPSDLAGPLSTVERPSWSNVRSPFALCTATSIQSLALRHKTLLLDVSRGKISGSHQDCKNLSTAMAQMLPRFILRRTDETKLFGRRVNKLPPLEMLWEAPQPPDTLIRSTYIDVVSPKRRPISS